MWRLGCGAISAVLSILHNAGKLLRIRCFWLEAVSECDIKNQVDSIGGVICGLWYSPRIVEDISPEQVRNEVRRFWKVYCSKREDEFAKLYFPDATILEIDARRCRASLADGGLPGP